MKLYIKNNGVQIPTQATPLDAGYDIVATTRPKIFGEFIERPLDGLKLYKRVAFIEYGTNLFVAPVGETEKLFKTFRADASGAICDVDIEEITKNYHIEIFPRSSLSKYNLSLCNSVATIDNGYRGEILLRFNYLFQPEDLIVLDEAGGRKTYGIVNPDHIYNQGDKIGQIKARPNIDIEFESVDAFYSTVRGNGGFGSTGK